MLKLFSPFVSWRAIWGAVKVLRSSYLAEGEEVKKFEKEFGDYFGVENVVAVNSGTSALELAYDLAKLKKGDHVITPVLTCTATNLPLVRRGVKIDFADIGFNLNVDCEDVLKRITAKTKAIVFVHFGGNNFGLRRLLDICQKRKIILIEDAAQAIGSNYWGQADFTAVSLQAIKNLTSGDGGFLLCKKKEDYLRAKRLRWFGYDREKKQKLGDTDLLEAGYKYHMNNITAAIGRGNLQSLPKLLNHLDKLKTIYEEISEVKCHAWLCIFTHPKAKEVENFLHSRGIESNQHHYRNDKYTVFGGRKKLPVMDKLENGWTLLPYHRGVSIQQARKIVELIKWNLKI